MQIQAIGHIVLKVRNLERSVAFYRDILGLREVGRYRNAMAFLTFGDNHHDLAFCKSVSTRRTPRSTVRGSTMSRLRSATPSMTCAPAKRIWKHTAFH